MHVLKAAALLAACGVMTACGSSAMEVEIDGIAFAPKRLEVEVGTDVTWVNFDDVAHTITSGVQAEQGVPGVSEGEDARPDGTFDGRLDGKDASFSYTFGDAGTYEYYCAIHVGMVGKIVVN